MERSTVKFVRRFKLPENAKVGEIKAAMEDGVLTVTVPKGEDKKPEMFGREAAKLLDYVECFLDGFKKRTYMANACQEAKLEGFPTWFINGEASKHILISV